ncbi:ribonuclease H1 [Mantella aurantiaca]
MFKLSSSVLTSARFLCASIRSPQALMVRMFYAVRRGRKPGVYNTWDECKKQVECFAGARYKKFGCEQDAWKFVRETDVAPSNSSETGSCETQSPSLSKEKPHHVKPSFNAKRPLPSSISSKAPSTPKRTKLIDISSQPPLFGQSFTHMGDATVVYTDGCCSQNGRLKARAGIGVYWGPNHPMNVAERLEGRPTNQRAEIQAACKAVEQAKSQNITKLVLYTDSMFTINGITKWIHNWKKNGWKLSTGANVINRTDFEKLDMLVQGIDVKWMHIPGHAGFGGNEAADRLAREGAQKSESSSLSDYPPRGERSAVVYTDGCCSSNGRYGAKGGIGVYWGPDSSLNVSEKLEGRQTNQRAEIQAACRAVEQAQSQNINRLNICTDSEFTIKGMTEWVPRWKQNDWKTYNGGNVVNKEDFQKLDNLCKEVDVTWSHVPGHSGNMGNERADQLAKSGARK